MAAPKGNTFYKLRSECGRKRLFSSPGALYKAACTYFDWCDANPWIKIDYKGSGAVKVEIPTARPYTMAALCKHLGVNLSYFNQLKTSLKEKKGTTDLNTEDFSLVKWLQTIEFIEQTIYVQKFEGAAVGAFNANIISRELGLVDKNSLEVDYNRLSENDLDAIINRLAAIGGSDHE